MPFEAGKYDELCTHAREQARAQGVVLFVMNGTRGSGLSVQGPMHLQLALPALLEEIAQKIREDWKTGEAPNRATNGGGSEP